MGFIYFVYFFTIINNKLEGFAIEITLTTRLRWAFRFYCFFHAIISTNTPYVLKLNVLRASIYVYSINYICVIHLRAANSERNTWPGRDVFEVFIIYGTKWLSAKRICTWLMVYVYTYTCIIYEPEKRWKSFTTYIYIYVLCMCSEHVTAKRCTWNP